MCWGSLWRRWSLWRGEHNRTASTSPATQAPLGQEHSRLSGCCLLQKVLLFFPLPTIWPFKSAQAKWQLQISQLLGCRAVDVQCVVLSFHLYPDHSCHLGQEEVFLLIDWLCARKTCLSPEHHVIIWWWGVAMARQLRTDCCWNIRESGHSVTGLSHPHTRAVFLPQGLLLALLAQQGRSTEIRQILAVPQPQRGLVVSGLCLRPGVL